MGLASFSLSSCLDVVPEETSEWKPEIAPQATVVNSTGNKYCVPFPLSTANPPNAYGYCIRSWRTCYHWYYGGRYELPSHLSVYKDMDVDRWSLHCPPLLFHPYGYVPQVISFPCSLLFRSFPALQVDIPIINMLPAFFQYVIATSYIFSPL